RETKLAKAATQRSETSRGLPLRSDDGMLSIPWTSTLRKESPSSGGACGGRSTMLIDPSAGITQIRFSGLADQPPLSACGAPRLCAKYKSAAYAQLRAKRLTGRNCGS